MAQEMFSKDQLSKLNEEAKRLEEHYEAQSEAVKIETRRRYDQAVAVLRPVTSIWERIDEIKAALDASRRSKWPQILAGMFFGGTALSWWLSPSGEVTLNAGTILMISAAFGYAGLRWERWNLDKAFDRLLWQQDQLLCQWEATGARSEEFFGHRDRTRAEAKLHELPESERDKAVKDLELRWYILRFQLRKALLLRASGTRESLWLATGEIENVFEKDLW